MRRRENSSDQKSLGEERGDKLPARGAEHAQQREVSAPADDRQRLCGKDEQSSGEQRDEREDVQIDAVGSRQARACREARLRTLDGEARRKPLSQLVAKRGKIHSGLEPQIDARNHAQPIEVRLCSCDVHHRETLVLSGRNVARDGEGNLA